MEWYKIELTKYDVIHTNRLEELQDKFGSIYDVSNPSIDVAMFAYDNLDGEIVLYFTPAAVTMAKEFLVLEEAIPCQRPVVSDDLAEFGLLIGHEDSLEMFMNGSIDRE